MNTKNFVLFSDCIPVKGAKRSLVCDMQNNEYHFIPNGLCDILEKYNGKTIQFIKQEFNNNYDDVINEYFDFLLSKKLIFFTSNPDLFPKMNLKWDSPSLITNIIIDVEDIEHDYKSIIKELEYLKCSYIQFRFFKETSINYISKLAQLIEQEKSRIVSIDFIIPYKDDFFKKELDTLLKQNPRIHSVILFNAPNDENYDAIRDKMGYLMFMKKNILNEKHCGIINKEYFYSNIKLFSESQQHNTCLNRKIAITKDGDIKNCPSMLESFGNIKSTTLKEALSKTTFKKYWNISKDQIDVCKDCEFRHICTDCRAYIENPKDKFSKPLKCGYSPYTNKWEEWSTNSVKQKAIKTYDMTDLIVND